MRYKTSLETIAEKLAEKKSEELEDILMRSGSMASKKNEYGITVVDDDNAASSLVFKSINRPKLDKVEIEKAIDIEITELKPNIPTKRKDLVPKPLYDEQVALVADLTAQVNELNQEISDLNSQIQTLQTELESEINNRLTIEQTNDALSNQLASLSQTIEDFSNQIQSAVQKSVEESILRASLQSQNAGFKVQVEALIKQIDSLNSIIEGLQAQLGSVQNQQAIEQEAKGLAASSGGEIINKVVVVDFSPVGQKNEPKMQLKFNNKSEEAAWERGEIIKLTNSDKQPVDVQIEHSYSEGFWFSLPKTSFIIPAGASEEIKCVYRQNFRWGHKDHSRFVDGRLSISVKRYDNSVQSKDMLTRLRIQHPKSY